VGFLHRETFLWRGKFPGEVGNLHAVGGVVFPDIIWKTVRNLKKETIFLN
jgi:hypothetical protein